MAAAPPQLDVVVIGGGPAGAITARQLALGGLDVVLLERQPMPRFQIGESLLPRTFDQLRDLGLGAQLEQLPRVTKGGAEFVVGHGLDAPSWAHFSEALDGTGEESVNITRAPFDAMLVEAAREAGARVEEGVGVRGLNCLEEGRVELEAKGPEGSSRQWRARWLVDASGQATVVGRHLGSRQALPLERRVACFGHFRGVRRHAGEAGGYISIVICQEGWFWLIPLDDEHTSIGLVIDQEAARKSGVAAREVLAWGIERCPVVAERCQAAELVGATRVRADFSYSCRPYAGSGYFLVGDAATFIDPIFSTGVCLGMMSGAEAALHLLRILRQGRSAKPLLRKYRRYVERSSRTFYRLVEQFYDPAFRDLFLGTKGPLGVHRAMLSVLAGDVYPRPRFSMRWRMALMELFIVLQRRVGLAPRRQAYSLLDRAGASSFPTAAAPAAGGFSSAPVEE